MHPKNTQNQTDDFVKYIKEDGNIKIKSVNVESKNSIRDLADDFLGGNKLLAAMGKLCLMPWQASDSLLSLSEQSLTNEQALRLDNLYVQIQIEGSHGSVFKTDFQDSLVDLLFDSKNKIMNKERWKKELEERNQKKGFWSFFGEMFI